MTSPQRGSTILQHHMHRIILQQTSIGLRVQQISLQHPCIQGPTLQHTGLDLRDQPISLHPGNWRLQVDLFCQRRETGSTTPVPETTWPSRGGSRKISWGPPFQVAIPFPELQRRREELSVPATTPVKKEAGSPEKRPGFADWGTDISAQGSLKETLLAWIPLEKLEALPTNLHRTIPFSRTRT